MRPFSLSPAQFLLAVVLAVFFSFFGVAAQAATPAEGLRHVTTYLPAWATPYLPTDEGNTPDRTAGLIDPEDPPADPSPEPEEIASADPSNPADDPAPEPEEIARLIDPEDPAPDPEPAETA